MSNLTKIIKEHLIKELNKTLVLLEDTKISKELQYHIENGLTLTNNVFTVYSKKYFDLINEVRDLWMYNLIQLNEEDEQIVLSDIGRIALYEGKMVYLDAPIEDFPKIGNYLSNRNVHKFLTEAWDDEMRKLKNYGMEVVEQFNSGPYNMLLIKMGDIHQIALTTNEGEFTSFEAQVSKPSTQKSNFMRIGRELVEKLEEWLSEYGDLFVGSYNEERTNKYHRIFSKMGLNIGDINGQDLGNEIISYYFPIYSSNDNLNEAKYKGRTVTLNKPMQGDVKKSQVFVKNEKGNVIKVNFGFGGTSAKGKVMRIKKSNPERRKNFRARHNCDNPGPKTKARYWSCRAW
jgi:hypothetical protein